MQASPRQVVGADVSEAFISASCNRQCSGMSLTHAKTNRNHNVLPDFETTNVETGRDKKTILVASRLN
jgi:hypothetical protein